MRILDLSTALLDEVCDPDERRQESMGAGIAKNREEIVQFCR